jgi:biopolymer transport protein ExbD
MSGIVFRKPRARKQVDLNVTSLVDVLFLLLIFFTLTSTFKRAGEINLKLPKSTTAEHSAAGANQQPVDLVLTEKGTLFLDGSPTTFEALAPKLRSAHDRQPDRQVMIEAEERVGHGQVVRLLDAVRTAGFTGVGIGVRNAPPVPAGHPNP